MKSFDKYGIKVPELLLPAEKVDLQSWAVIACDQYTQDRDYWERCRKNAENKPSTLNLILPEVYLNDADKSERIKRIHNTMNEYMQNGVFAKPESGFMYIERTTAYGRVRKGLIVALDLETYEWKPFSKALTRATEATIVERIPPRMEIRRGAALESPHIMLLLNDPEKCLIEAAGKKAAAEKPYYSTNLMENSGSIKGWLINSEEGLSAVEKALEKLYQNGTAEDGSTFLFAVGDGNHSLATAKAVWDEYKENNGGFEKTKDADCRYALVELVNIYDDGLTFEPIHRVLFDTKAEKLAEYLKGKLGGSIKKLNTKEELEKAVASSKANFGFVSTEGFLLLETQITELPVSRLQPALDDFIKESENKPEIDYIHGSDEVFRLGAKPDAVSILLPPIAKDSFFATINKTGPLPRKSFSMGESSEKRFYMECRKLF